GKPGVRLTLRGVPDGAKPDVGAFHQLLREALELPIAAGPAPYFGCEVTYAVA
nr:hypothetical protein [Tanacetum cinerariifolium]